MRRLLLILLIFLPILIYSYPQQEWQEPETVDYASVRADSAHGFDVTHYALYIVVDTSAETITGTVEAEVTATEAITEITYNLVDLTVDAVLVNGTAADYEHDGEYLTIELGGISSGEDFSTSVSYHGEPSSSPGYGCGIFWHNSYVFSVSDPDASRYWWPCYDHPWDKAIVDLHITMRDDWLCAANGIRTGIESNGDNTNTTHWIGEHPMTTYLVCFHGSNFVEFTQSCNLPGGEELLIHNFCPPNQLTNTQEDFSNIPWMIEYFSEIYGPYPFEKFGNCVVPMSVFAGMEHQTMVTLANYLITGNHTYETVFAHELAHHWFGDCVAFLDFPHVWLSEGFAVYSEALWTEEWQGYEAMLDYVAANIHGYYLNWAGGSNYTIYDPSYINYFTPPEYEKAASVLHHIRMQAGDEAFFEILQTYFATYMHSNAVTSEFQEIVENVTGEDYEQFFEQWIYGSGVPNYEYTWFYNPYDDIPKLRTYVKTTSSSATEFYMKTPFVVTYEGGEQEKVLAAAGPQVMSTELLIEGGLLTATDFDPEGWLLQRGKTEHRLALSGAYPFQGGAALNWNDLWAGEVAVDGYNLYRAESAAGAYQRVNTELIAEQMYLDNGLETGSTYYYKVQAVIDGEFESRKSEEMAVTIVEWPLDQGVLIVDESADGNGNPGNPSEEQVDDFYSAVTGIAVTEYDYASAGAIDIETIRNYSTVIWHDADISQKNITANESVLSSYVYAGGNLLISGWKTGSYLSDNFLETMAGSAEVYLANEQELTGAESAVYCDLIIDGDKLPTIFEGHLPYTCIFPAAEDAIYTFAGDAGNPYQGEPIATGGSISGECLILGFPLYYCEESGAAEFMEAVLAEFEGSAIEEEELIEPLLSLQVYPNPFTAGMRSSIKIDYDLGAADSGSLGIYNIRGQQIDHLLLDKRNGEEYWHVPEQLSSGIYFMLLQSGEKRSGSKCLIIK